ncbi:hypothetical protein B0H13DRAFT_2014228 [Mycena leptocephala]|nr:hypothetical protein B0H13DRAFT_2014228 [Mycena leptocephala]
MSFLLRLFRSEKPPDDESILADLARDIARRQGLLSEIRARERTATALVTLYTLAAWCIYVGVWYFGFVSARRQARSVERAVRALPVFVGPILILFIRRIVQIWYARKGNVEEKTLQTLLKAQRTKVEEIKKKTNFYETRELLSRYDSGADGSASTPNTPQRGEGRGRPSLIQGGQGQTPQRPGGPRPSILTGGPSAGPPPPQQPPQPQGPPRRGWFDALADVLVGPDDSAQVDKEKQKFALICGKCFAHNGLVPEGVWGDVQYACPKCGHFNPSARSRGALPGGSPTTSSMSASQAGARIAGLPTSPLSAMSTSTFSPVPPPTQGRGGGQEAPAGGDAQAKGGSGREARGSGDVRRRAARGGEEEMEVDS